MSILDDEEIHMNGLDVIGIKTKDAIELEKDINHLLSLGCVRCIVSSPENNLLINKLSEIYDEFSNDLSFASCIRRIVNEPFSNLSNHKDREVLSLDCRYLKKGDGLGFMKTISKNDHNPIVIFENITQIPEQDLYIYDNKEYVKNLLIRSWKNEDIFIDDIHICRRNLTIILTCPPEDEDKLRTECSMCSYGWVGNIE